MLVDENVSLTGKKKKEHFEFLYINLCKIRKPEYSIRHEMVSLSGPPDGKGSQPPSCKSC